MAASRSASRHDRLNEDVPESSGLVTGAETVDSAVVRTFSETSAAFARELAKKKRDRQSAGDGAGAGGDAEDDEKKGAGAGSSGGGGGGGGMSPRKKKTAGSKFLEEERKRKATGTKDDDGNLDKEKIEEIDIEEHMWTVERAAEFYQVDLAKGLSSEVAAERLLEYGRNELTPPPSKHWLLVFMSHMTGFFSLLLWGASIMCFIAYGLDDSDPSNLYLGIVLAVVVFMTGIFSYFQDAKSQAVMEGFKNFLPAQCTVLRDGLVTEILAAEVVPGDIVRVKAGEKIPADIRILEFSNFKVDNASLTGESLPQKRTVANEEENPLEATNLAFYGTLCVSGNCTALVVRTADKTVIGMIAKLASGTGTTETPIAIEIEHFIKIISAVAIFLGVTFLIINFAKGTSAIDNVVFCIGIIVANVPEGLLATVTVSLTLTAKRMAAKKVLVKNLESVETLGSTTVIASDKTGTLTQNRMTVSHLWYDNATHTAYGDGDDKYDEENESFIQLRKIITLCCNAEFLQEPANLQLNVLQRRTKGDASESAFIKFCEPIDPILEVRARHNTVGQVPFNSHNKFQVTIHLAEGNDEAADRLLLMKGAPERVWNRCTTVLINGEKVPVADVAEDYFKAQRRLMGDGERVLGCCMRTLPAEDFPMDFEYDPEEMNFPMGEMTFVGLVSMIDPPRPAVPGAVLSCQHAGIKVIMVTGDHPLTAEAIAKKVHIVRSPTRRDVADRRGVEVEEVDPNDPEIEAMVVTGAMLSEMDDEELDNVLDYDQIVFARTSPQQKLIIVKGLQAKQWQRRGQVKPKRVRHVVAVTGDGVNDSPALKAADIGVAMGIVGSDVAKDAADMILLNDNFASIVDGVEEGRLIFDNLKKSIAYTLSSNIPEISPFLLNIILGIPLPLTTVLILCVDLGTDLVPAISLAYEGKEANIMEKPPRDMNTDRLVTTKLISFSYLQIGIIQALAGFYTYFTVLNDYGFDPSILPGLEDVFEDGTVDMSTSPPTLVSEDGSDRYLLKECTVTGRLSDVCHDPEEALAHAQSAYFVCIVVVQWADILACKTRSLSLKHQGMRNNWLNFGLVFETVLAVMLCYITPLNPALGTRDIALIHWLPGLPFAILIVAYDEVRKWLLRTQGPNNWFERNTYY